MKQILLFPVSELLYKIHSCKMIQRSIWISSSTFWNTTKGAVYTVRKRKREVKRKSESVKERRRERASERARGGEKHGAVANVATLSLPASSEHVRSVNYSTTPLPLEIVAVVVGDEKDDDGLAATLPAKHRSDNMLRIRAERRRPRDRFYQRRPTSNIV